MKSPQSLILIIFLIITIATTTSASSTKSNDTRKAKISNYKPEKQNLASHPNGEPQVNSYSVSVSNVNNKYRNHSDGAGLDFLKAHNEVRQRSGLVSFVWDARLANFSAKYAASRHDDCNMVHSNGPYGENIFWGTGSEWTPAEVVQLWVREHRYYNRQTKKCASGQMCGHYTQIVWRNTHHLGCTKINCATGDTFAICNYDPPGNYVGEGPFDRNN